MNDHVEIGHLTKFDAFRVNRDQVMDLESWFKIHTNVSNFETASPKTMSLYGFGGRCLKTRDVCMDFEPYFKVHNLVNIHPKSIKLGQMTNLNMIVYVLVSDYRLVKI